MDFKKINYSDFEKVDIRLGTIIEAEEYDKMGSWIRNLGSWIINFVWFDIGSVNSCKGALMG